MQVPKTVMYLLRETISNVQSHLDVLTLFKDNNVFDLNNFNIDDIPKAFEDTNFHKIGSQQYIKNFIKGIIDSLKTFKNSPLDIPENITSWFEPTTLNYDRTNNKWKSKEGIVSVVNLKFPDGQVIQNFAIMKLQQPSAFDDENLIHEITVGLILNNLRDYLPCFMYTYGGIFCGYPKEYSMKDNDYRDLCKGNDPHSILITEYIPGNLTIEEFINQPAYSQLQEDDKIKVLLLLAFSLNEANERYKFIHGDLHGKNIMIRTLLVETDFTFPYKDDKLGNINIKITTKYVPIIIDYGRTFIDYDGYRLSPIESTANNRDLKKDAGLSELWCNGKANETGENCLIENLVYKGAYIPGYDFFRLLLAINILQLRAEFKDIVTNCFYGGVYSFFFKNGTHHWNGKLNGSTTNYLKFSNQGLSYSTDTVNNPNCKTTGFLGTILIDPYFTKRILTITTPL
jgi:hypothetical protein